METLRYASAVARLGSFSAAARECGVSQPALSNGIARLEGRLGRELFERSPRGVTPTAFARRALPHIDMALSNVDALEVLAAQHGPDTVRVGISPLINAQLVARAYAAVAGEDTGRKQLVLREDNMEDLRVALRSSDLDLIVVPSVGPMPGFEHRIIDSEPVVLVDGSAAEEGRPVRVVQLRDNPLILLPDTCGLTRFTCDLVGDATVYPGEAANYRTLEEWSRMGLGTAIVPISKLTGPEVPRRTIVDEDGGELEIFYEAVWNPASPLAESLGELVARMTR